MMIIDIYEPKNIEFLLKQLGIQIERKRMKSGDYIFADIGIERKSVNDFFNSIYKRRLFDQMYNLSLTYDRPLLFIMGDMPPTERWMKIGRRRLPIKLSEEEQEKKLNTYYKTVNTIYNSYKVPTFYCRSERRFILQLSDLYFKTMGTELKLKPVKPKHHHVPEIKSDMFACLPYVGRKGANYLASKFTIKKFSKLTIKQLMKLEKIGKKKAELIYKVLNE